MALLTGWDYNMAFIRYGDWWRRHMRAFHHFFNSKAVAAFEPVKLETRRQLLRNLLDNPENFSEHLKYSVGRVIMDVVYAIEIKPENDPIIIRIHITSEGFGRTSNGFLIGFRAYRSKTLQKNRDLTQDLSNIPFNIVKNRESPDYSFVSTSLERLRRLQDFQFDEETVIKNVSGTACAAGANTLQEELDRVLGDRLPNLEDRKDLPYLNAFLAEVMRWRPLLPLGIPHAVQEDDGYGEYFIPKGSIIIADSWYDLVFHLYFFDTLAPIGKFYGMTNMARTLKNLTQKDFFNLAFLGQQSNSGLEGGLYSSFLSVENHGRE
ncbi:hypothetical protein Clacol_007783 [Clathrus columnatus]|uniref:Uncharacterized protein n=1 Tax=Clathrus columnatus TaxID=1419009 RepID=A0AAV5AFW6_9AGAM|nr:hypothetical protein Clacol_007783 [Clathrus columnatus]